MTQQIEATPTATNVRDVTFNFKSVKATHPNFTRDRDALIAAGIPHTVQTEKDKDQQDVVVAIKRDSLTVQLPAYTAADFPPEFIQQRLNLLIAEAAKKSFVDKFLPVDVAAFTPAFIVTALESSSDAGSGLSKELVAEAAAFLKEVLKANGLGQAQVDIIGNLVEAKFSPKTIKANILIAPKIPAIFQTIGKVYNASPEALAKHQPVIEACMANYEKYVAEANAAQSLEFAI